jgi:hypothetical protein
VHHSHFVDRIDGAPSRVVKAPVAALRQVAERRSPGSVGTVQALHATLVQWQQGRAAAAKSAQYQVRKTGIVCREALFVVGTDMHANIAQRRRLLTSHPSRPPRTKAHQ